MFMDSSVGTEMGERLRLAQEAARRAKEREASTQRQIEALEAAMARLQAHPRP